MATRSPSILGWASDLLNPLRSLKHQIVRRIRETRLKRKVMQSLRPLANSRIRALPVFCISLPNAVHRQQIVRKQVRKLGFCNFAFFPAVDGREKSTAEWEASGQYDGTAARERFGMDLSRPNIGCTLSHIAVLKHIHELGLECAVVLEDDVLLDATRLDELSLDVLPVDWDIVFLTALYAQIPPVDPIAPGLFGAASYGGSTAAYLVSAQGARKLLRYALPLSWAADGFMGYYMRDIVTHREDVAYRAYLLWPPAARNGSLDGGFTSAIHGAAS